MFFSHCIQNQLICLRVSDALEVLSLLVHQHCPRTNTRAPEYKDLPLNPALQHVREFDFF